MKLEQSFEVAAPVERVWEALIDVERVAPCLPGAAITGRNVFEAVTQHVLALQVARKLGAGKRVVTVIPDSAERYLSKNIFDGGI